jgi:hypothetical protein
MVPDTPNKKPPRSGTVVSLVPCLFSTRAKFLLFFLKGQAAEAKMAGAARSHKTRIFFAPLRHARFAAPSSAP